MSSTGNKKNPVCFGFVVIIFEVVFAFSEAVTLSNGLSVSDLVVLARPPLVN